MKVKPVLQTPNMGISPKKTSLAFVFFFSSGFFESAHRLTAQSGTACQVRIMSDRKLSVDLRRLWLYLRWSRGGGGTKESDLGSGRLGWKCVEIQPPRTKILEPENTLEKEKHRPKPPIFWGYMLVFGGVSVGPSPFVRHIPYSPSSWTHHGTKAASCLLSRGSFSAPFSVDEKVETDQRTANPPKV